MATKFHFDPETVMEYFAYCDAHDSQYFGSQCVRLTQEEYEICTVIFS